MSTKKTENLGLHAWERTDVFSMDEFNENFDAIDKAVGAKAEQTALDAEKSARETAGAAETAAREALAGQVAALDAARLRYKFDSYTGNGEAGSKTPNRLEFDFKPLMLFIVHPSSQNYGGFPWLRGMLFGHSYLNSTGGNNSMRLSWEDRAVQWYNPNSSPSAGYQLNEDGTTYWYLALGVAE